MVQKRTRDFLNLNKTLGDETFSIGDDSDIKWETLSEIQENMIEMKDLKAVNRAKPRIFSPDTGFNVPFVNISYKIGKMAWLLKNSWISFFLMSAGCYLLYW